MITDDTLVIVNIDDPLALTLRELFAANADDPLDEDAIRETLSRGDVYRGGGGASSAFTVRLVRVPG